MKFGSSTPISRVTVYDITSTLYIHSFHYAMVDSEWSFEIHHHSIFEIIYIISGEVTEWIHGEVIELKMGDLLFIAPGIRHSSLNKSGGSTSYISIHFNLDDAEFRKILGVSDFIHVTHSYSEKTALLSYINEIQAFIQPCLSNHMTNRQSLNELISLPFEQKLELQAHVILIIREMVNHIEHLRCVIRITKKITSAEIDLANLIANELDLAIYDVVSISAIADKIFLSRSHCTKVFSKVFGVSPRQYVSSLKLKKAKELLTYTDLSVESISNKMGFSSTQHFSRQFRRWTGTSPRSYRP